VIRGVRGHAARISDSVVDSAFVSYYAALIELRKSIGQLSSHLANPSREVLTDSIDSLATRVPVFSLGGGTGVSREWAAAALSGGPALCRISPEYPSGPLREVGAESQAQLGLQLRSVQIKGIILLITLFFTMMSLYIYLSIDQRLQDASLDLLNDRQRLGEAVPVQTVIDQEKAVTRATGIANSLWICLTVMVWLLVPLFKPVKDADIDTQQIYKIHTLANWGQGATDSTALAVPGGK
jgi:hypothetical protein